MIITCEKCDTRFKLDDDRIAAEGVKVRCSRCKHAFVVQPPEAGPAADDAVAESLARDVSAAPAGDRTQVLGAPDTEERTRMFEQGSVDFSGTTTELGADSDEESDWEFNEEPPESDAGLDTSPPAALSAPEAVPELASAAVPELASAAVPELAAAAVPELAAAAVPELATESAQESLSNQGGTAPEPVREPEPDLGSAEGEPVLGSAASTSADPMHDFLAADPGAEEAEPSIEDVGSPEEWDLLGEMGEIDESREALDTGADFGSLGDGEHDAEPSAIADLGLDEDDAAEEGVAQEAAESEPVADEATVAIPVSSELAASASWRSKAANWLGGAVVAALLALAAWGTLVPPPRVSSSVATASLGALEAAGVRASVVDNAVAGGLLVVSAELRNPGSSPRTPQGIVHVTLLDASGRVIEGPRALLALAPSESALRLESPERLIQAQYEQSEALAQTPLAPGESIRVAALFADVPLEAHGFRFDVTEPISSGADLPSPAHPAAE